MPYLFEDEELSQLRKQAERFASQHIQPHAHAWEEQGIFPKELYRQMAEAGLLGVGFPEEFDGMGGDLRHVLVSSEALILAGHSVGTVVGVGSHGIGLPPILAAAKPELKNRIAKEILSGEKISALAITEPGAGSDVANITTKAVKDGDHYVVNGAKTFITSGTRADYFTCAVRTGGPAHGGISLMVIDSNTPGFSVSRKLDKMGWWSSDTAELHFEDCRVPAGNLLGHENAGFLLIMQNFVSERIMLAGNCVAIAQLALDQAKAYCRDRKAFGKALMGHQVTRHKLADMATRLAAARALTSEVVVRHLRGEMVADLAAMAKNTATDMCCYVCDEAVQLFGGMGYMRETVVERLFRDARLYPIGGGTREIMNEIIAKMGGF